MTPPYADPPANNGIIRPKRPLTPQQSAALAQQLGAYRAPPVATAAPVIAAPAARNLNLADAPIPDAPDTSAAPQPVADAAGATAMSAPALKLADAPGTRHGLGGRIKDFLEAAMYGLAQDQGQHGRYGGLMSGLGAGMAAAAKPGALARYKWNNIEQPRIDERDARLNQQEALKQQGLLRAAQARKAQGDVEEDALSRPDRMALIRAQTQHAQAEAAKAGRPVADPAEPFHLIPDAENPTRWNPLTKRGEPILGADGQPVKRYIKPDRPERTGLTPGEQAAADRADRTEADALMSKHAELKAKATEAGAEVGAMNKALAGANEDGQALYKGKWITRADADRAEQARQAVSGEMQNAAHRLRATGRVTVSDDGTDVRPMARPTASAKVPAGTDAATAQRYAAWRAAKGLP